MSTKKKSPKLSDAVYRIAREIEQKMSPGEVAELRKLSATAPVTPIFWGVVTDYLRPFIPEKDPLRTDVEKQWAAILSGMARMRGLLQTGRRLGHALAEAGVSELRFVKLLQSRDAQLLSNVHRLTHQLANKAVTVDWTDFARLVLYQNTDDAEDFRHRVARDYYYPRKES